MKLYIARHGRTNYNDKNLCNADPSADVHITGLGVQQAHSLADKLKAASIDRIFISELQRTRQTAEIINEFHQAPVEVAPLLNDHRSGFEGQSAELLMAAMDAADNRWTARFNDGESIEDVKVRVAQFIDELKSKPYDSVLVITSGWLIYLVHAIIHGVSYEEAWKLDITQGNYLEMEI